MINFKSLQQARVEYFNYIFRRICKIIDDEFLTKKKTVATLLNEIFSTKKETNEEEIKSFVRDNDL